MTIPGWLVEFLVTVRHAQLAQYSYVSTGLFGGVALGRILLVEPTHRYGERNMLLLYSMVALVLQIIFWQVRIAVVDAVMVTLMGFVLGPFFAAVGIWHVLNHIQDCSRMKTDFEIGNVRDDKAPTKVTPYFSARTYLRRCTSRWHGFPCYHWSYCPQSWCGGSATHPRRADRGYGRELGARTKGQE
jgi:hypothetical protein